MSFTSTKLLLSVAEPILFLRGEASAASGCFLRGDLMLHLRKPTKFKKIELTFKGIAETRIPEGVIFNGTRMVESKEIISHTWTFFESPKDKVEPRTTASKSGHFKFLQHKKDSSQDSYLLPAGVYTFPFELLLPGTLPESVKVDFSSLSYKLKAKAVRAGVFPNMHAEHVIEIVRTLPDPEINLGIAIARDVDGNFGYEMTIPETAYALGTRIPIDIRVHPYHKRFKLYSVQAEVVEKTIYKAAGQNFSAERTIAELKVQDFEQTRLIDGDIDNVSSYHKTLLITLPKCAGPANYTCETPLLTIKHQIKIQFCIPSLSLPNKKTIVRAATQIRLLSCRCVDTHLNLPKYEDDSCFCPCDPIYQRTARLVLGEVNSLEPPPPPYELLQQVSSSEQSISSLSLSSLSSSTSSSDQEIEMETDDDSNNSLSDFVSIKAKPPSYLVTTNITTM